MPEGLDGLVADTVSRFSTSVVDTLQRAGLPNREDVIKKDDIITLYGEEHAIKQLLYSELENAAKPT